jgi:RED-like protein N-terminal region
MNNEQFRRLVLANGSQNASSDQNSSATATNRSGALGSRNKSSIPMTPRNIKGTGPMPFAQQLAANHAAQRPSKQFKSIAPRGSKLVDGYRDRTQERIDEDEDDKARRIKALEESLKKGEIEQDVFDKIRDEITGGEVENTHLVKGLDWKLLARIKRGEDISQGGEGGEKAPKGGDIDDEFETLEQQEVKAMQKKEKEKKGSLAAAPVAGKKRTRDEILAELKASRKKATETAAPQLGLKFRKIGETMKKPTESQKSKLKDTSISTKMEAEPTPKLIPLDHDVVVPKQQEPEEESDDDIYADVGDEYNPLGDMEDEESGVKAEQKPDQITKTQSTEMQPPPRKLFDDASTSVLGSLTTAKDDAALIAAIQRSKETSTTQNQDTEPVDENETRLRKRAAELAGQDRDMDDIDMGFGSSRFDDAEEMAMEGTKVKLAEWKGGHNEEDEDEEGGAGKKGRKRKPKKRKGDKNSMADVMRVIEGRKA